MADPQSDRLKAIDTALGQIERQFGKGSIMRLGQQEAIGVPAIATGSLAVDAAIGVGGFPRGRVVEVYGPESSGKTTLALSVVAQAQKAGGIAAFIDAEHALDAEYAAKLGVDIENLLVSQPDSGEQALEIAEMLVRSNAVDIVCVDSVAALVPRAELEGEMGDSHVGLQARLMSQALRKLTAIVAKSRTTLVFINQIREKIGVMFGCLSYSSRVMLADGSQEKIGKIVNQKLPVEVLSYDRKLGRVVPKPVVSWFDNGRTDRFLQFTVAKPGKNGRAQFGCTTNHPIRTPDGWRRAHELSAGDRVLQALPHHLSKLQWEAALGMLMGDGALSPSRSGFSARLRWGHGSRQIEYGDWKASLFSNLKVSRSSNAKGAVFYDVQPLVELAELRRTVYRDGKKVFDQAYFERLSPLSLAIWYMDDASFALRSKGLQARTAGGSGRAEICVQAMSPDSRRRLVKHLAERWDLHPKLIRRADKAVLQFPTAETRKLQELIAPFVHPSMSYKLLPPLQGRFSVKPKFSPPRHELVPTPITGIHVKPKTRSMQRFDIEIDGTHNFFADGVMVHNSPETTTGGRALKFYSSVRVDIRRIASIKDGDQVTGIRAKVKIVKNKVAPPFRAAEFDIDYGEGISRAGELLDLGVEHKVVGKSGAWYNYGDVRLGQGRENSKQFLRDNPDLANEIEEALREKLGLPGATPKEAPPVAEVAETKAAAES